MKHGIGPSEIWSTVSFSIFDVVQTEQTSQRVHVWFCFWLQIESTYLQKKMLNIIYLLNSYQTRELWYSRVMSRSGILDIPTYSISHESYSCHFVDPLSIGCKFRIEEYNYSIMKTGNRDESPCLMKPVESFFCQNSINGDRLWDLRGVIFLFILKALSIGARSFVLNEVPMTNDKLEGSYLSNNGL